MIKLIQSGLEDKKPDEAPTRSRHHFIYGFLDGFAPVKGLWIDDTRAVHFYEALNSYESLVEVWNSVGMSMTGALEQFEPDGETSKNTKPTSEPASGESDESKQVA